MEREARKEQEKEYTDNTVEEVALRNAANHKATETKTVGNKNNQGLLKTQHRTRDGPPRGDPD